MVSEQNVEKDEPTPTMTARGFQHHEPIPSEYGGEVRVYESSAASGPHIWLTATAPENLNDPEGNEVKAPLHLTLANATRLRDQLTQLIENHYQVSNTPAKPTHD